jgi:hypothetical protein
MFETSVMQRDRFWEGMLQRLSGPASEPEAKGTPNGVDERGCAGSARRRRIGHEEQNIPSQNLARVSRKNTNAKALASGIKKEYKR